MRPQTKPGAKTACWGVVQLVGHLTVNEDGEGSNPSAPANFPSRNVGIGGVGCFYTDCTTFHQDQFHFSSNRTATWNGTVVHQDQKNIPVCPGGPRGTGIEEEPEKSSLSLQL